MIYVFLAKGFEETEALATVDVLRRAELDVVTVGIGGKEVTGSHQITVLADIEDKEVTTENIEAIVLPGGIPGTLNLEKSPIVNVCVDYCINNQLYIGAICAAPSILGHKGLLSGKTATCAPGFTEQLTGANVSQEAVVTDGKIITGKGMGVTIDFALEMVKHLKGESIAQGIRMAIQCP